jgi:uncharacterized membrane protein
MHVSGSRLQAFTLLALCSLLWAGNWVTGRALRDAFDPVSLNFWRWLLATLMLAPFALPGLRGKWPLVRAHAGILLLLALTGVAVFHSLIYLGLRTTTTVNAVLLNSSIPLFMLACSWILERERASTRQVAGMLLSLAGILVILSRGDATNLLRLELHAGDAWILLAMPIWGRLLGVAKAQACGAGRAGVLFSHLGSRSRHAGAAGGRHRHRRAAADAGRGRAAGRAVCRCGRLGAGLHLLEPRRRHRRRERGRLHAAPAARFRHRARDPVTRRILRRLPRRGHRRDPRGRGARDAPRGLSYFSFE